MDLNGNGILFITDENEVLIGTLTDGDIRRWLIKTGQINVETSEIMNWNPRFLFESDNTDASSFIRDNRIRAVPILDVKKHIVDIVFSTKRDRKHSGMSKALSGYSTIIMAGGKGTRLYPYTKILPKPLIPIEDIPIIERIMNRFHSYGIEDFYVTVNYKKDMIRAYFKDQNVPYRIHFIEENQPLGTAGSITLIQERFEYPVIVTNCDILIQAEYDRIVEHHIQSQNVMTIVSSLKNTRIPYGVLHSQNEGIITSMEEKPEISFFINTGMYVVSPMYLDLIPTDREYHMTQFAERLIKDGHRVGMYPISEKSFLDMGEFEEMKKMEERINEGYVQ